MFDPYSLEWCYSNAWADSVFTLHKLKKARQNITYRIYNYLLTPGAASALLVSIDLTSAEATVDLTKTACS